MSSLSTISIPFTINLVTIFLHFLELAYAWKNLIFWSLYNSYWTLEHRHRRISSWIRIERRVSFSATLSDLSWYVRILSSTWESSYLIHFIMIFFLIIISSLVLLFHFFSFLLIVLSFWTRLAAWSLRLGALFHHDSNSPSKFSIEHQKFSNLNTLLLEIDKVSLQPFW